MFALTLKLAPNFLFDSYEMTPKLTWPKPCFRPTFVVLFGPIFDDFIINAKSGGFAPCFALIRPGRGFAPSLF